MTTPPDPPGRSYGCSYGCGNPYDYVIVSIVDATTLFLCTPCFVRTASDMVAAITESPDLPVGYTLTDKGQEAYSVVPGPSGSRRGHNAPAEIDDPDLIETYSDVITEEDLPDEFL